MAEDTEEEGVVVEEAMEIQEDNHSPCHASLHGSCTSSSLLSVAESSDVRDWSEKVKKMALYILPPKKDLLAIGLGQILSLIIAGTGVTSQQLASKWGVNIPVAQSCLNYLLLSLYGFVLLWKRVYVTDLKRVLMYCGLALVDVEANYLVVKAYQYTDITSVMLLDCFSIPCVMLLSFLFLKARYQLHHFVGVAVCLSGLVVLVVSDALFNGNPDASKPILGDVLCLAGAALYAVSNVGQEYAVNKYSRVEYLSMLGVFGSLISAVQLFVFEYEELETLKWNWQIVSLIVGFSLCLFLLYSCTPYLLLMSTATVMNLSFLTSDVLGILAGVFLFGYVPSPLYFGAFLVIIVGIFVYNVSSGSDKAHNSPEDDPPPLNVSKPETATSCTVGANQCNTI